MPGDKFKAPSLEESKKLYELAGRLKTLAPWEWMEESDLFGVQNPETGEIGFISVMGMAGEHFAVSVYQGPEGLYGFWDMEESGPFGNPQEILEVPQLQVSFEDRDTLEKQDRDLIKKLGLKYRGAHAWPMFRSYRPGYLPWFVTSEEARFLAWAIEQTLEVAPRVKDNPNILFDESDEEDEVYLVRVPREPEGVLYWEERMIRIPEPAAPEIPVVMEPGLVEKAAKLPLIKLNIEMDFFSVPAPVAEKGQRPFLPYMLMIADSRTGMILGADLKSPEPTLEAMWGKVPQGFVESCLESGSIPEQIIVRSDRLYRLFLPLTQSLRFRLRQSEELPALDAAMDSMTQMLGGGMFDE
jgi:hypothetical protein